jgi:hypothetical protein
MESLHFVLVCAGYVRTYADDYFHRPSEDSNLYAATVFLIAFGAVVISFIVVFLLGTLIFGIFDNDSRVHGVCFSIILLLQLVLLLSRPWVKHFERSDLDEHGAFATTDLSHDVQKCPL